MRVARILVSVPTVLTLCVAACGSSHSSTSPQDASSPEDSHVGTKKDASGHHDAGGDSMVKKGHDAGVDGHVTSHPDAKADSPVGSGNDGGVDTGTGADTGTAADTGGGSATCAGFNVVGGIFSAAEPWNTAVDQDLPSTGSAAIISGLATAGGWGNGNVMQIDTSINILCADATTPLMPFTLAGGACSPDCDSNTTFPVPAGGAVEGETGYACNGGGDCHLLVVDKATNQLWEMYQAFDPPDPNVFNTQTGAFLWDLTKAYPANLRGDGCTSADAGGFPIAAMLFTADEVAAGHIDHAIRLILPNPRIQGGKVYVHPGTHTTSSASGGAGTTPPYGAHFRLSSTFQVSSLPSAGAQVIAKAMQKYGLFLADGGQIALTAANDQFTTAKWTDADVNVDPTALSSLKVSDFDIVDMGALVTTGDNCIRNP
jgi:hypothetical protein